MLAWEGHHHGTQADGTPSRLATYVDAAPAAVLRRVEGIHTADGSRAVALQRDGGAVDHAASGSSYTLTDPARGNARTTDMRNREDSILCQLLRVGCSGRYGVLSTDVSFGSGTNANRESAAVDAHYGGGDDLRLLQA